MLLTGLCRSWSENQTVGFLTRRLIPVLRKSLFGISELMPIYDLSGNYQNVFAVNIHCKRTFFSEMGKCFFSNELIFCLYSCRICQNLETPKAGLRATRLTLSGHLERCQNFIICFYNACLSSPSAKY